MNRQLYLDLDGVMADYDKHFADLFPGHDLAALPKKEMWALVHSVPDFFSTIPPCDGALLRWDTWIGRYHPIVLTAAGTSNYEHVAKQKREWVRKQLGKHIQVIAVQDGLQKPLMMKNPGDILIDDWDKNTKAWEAEGGVPILHKNWYDTYEQFKDIYYRV